MDRARRQRILEKVGAAATGRFEAIARDLAYARAHLPPDGVRAEEARAARLYRMATADKLPPLGVPRAAAPAPALDLVGKTGRMARVSQLLRRLVW